LFTNVGDAPSVTLNLFENIALSFVEVSALKSLNHRQPSLMEVDYQLIKPVAVFQNR